MNKRAVFRVLGFIAAAVGAAMTPPTVAAALYHSDDLIPLCISAVVPFLLGLILLITTRGGKVDLGVKDGFAIVTFGWILAAIFGAMPYWLSGVCTSPIDAFFESMSGFTTTGSTILTDIESTPPGLLLWRSLSQWIGGMGIVVLSVAVLPFLGIGGMQLFKAEVPGPTNDRLTPRIQNAAKTLWGVYFAFTAAETALLMVGGMNLFEAVCHAFCTVSTGGFSTRNASIAAYDSVFIESVVIVFMFLSGVNFSLHLWPIRRKLPTYWKNEEFRLYLTVVLLAGLAVGLALWLQSGETIGHAVRLASFQVVSILTTTGFGTGDYLLWGFGAQMLLFLMMFAGASAGSTAGGMKLIRMIVLVKHGITMAVKELHPRAIYKIRYARSVVSDDVLTRILGFFLLYISAFFFVALVLATMGLNLETALGASIATLSNIGPGFGDVGPVSNFAELPGAAKVLLAFNMLLGRLELYTVLVLLTPTFWRRT